MPRNDIMPPSQLWIRPAKEGRKRFYKIELKYDSICWKSGRLDNSANCQKRRGVNCYFLDINRKIELI